MKIGVIVYFYYSLEFLQIYLLPFYWKVAKQNFSMKISGWKVQLKSFLKLHALGFEEETGKGPVSLS